MLKQKIEILSLADSKVPHGQLCKGRDIFILEERGKVC